MPGLNAIRTRARKEDGGIDRRFLGGEHGNANMNSVQPAAGTIPWSLTGECFRTVWIVCGQARWAYVRVCVLIEALTRVRRLQTPGRASRIVV